MVVYYVYEIRGPGVCVWVVFYRCYDMIGFQISQKIVCALRVRFVDGKQGAAVIFQVVVAQKVEIVICSVRVAYC